VTLVALALVYRPLVMECLDPGFLRVIGRAGPVAHMSFVTLVVLNLVGGFHALGTLMVVGLMMLTAAAARFWAETVPGQMAVAVVVGIASSLAGLLLSYHAAVPASPAIILSAGALYLASVLAGRHGSIAASVIRLRHLER
jgi:zinc/manganese transport system permease protein